MGRSKAVVKSLNVDFTYLERVVERFDSERVFRVRDSGDESMNPWREIPAELRSGKEVTLDKVLPLNGLLTVDGCQVVLYIRDHGSGIRTAIDDIASRRKLHVAECNTLAEMRQKKRFDRYVAIQHMSDDFLITGVDPITREDVSAEVPLQVCINCLKALNYNSYLLMDRNKQNLIRNNFSMKEFFETYSTLFRQLPNGVSAGSAAGYTRDWSDISRAIREASGGECEQCYVNLGANSHLLHVHHINGVKNDNRRSNLMCLCKDCHRKQPDHDHMFLTGDEMRLITRLRIEQGKVEKNWDSVFKHADLAMRPLLAMARHRQWEPPELGFAIPGKTGAISTEAAWPKRRIGIVNAEETQFPNGWTKKQSNGLLREIS